LIVAAAGTAYAQGNPCLTQVCVSLSTTATSLQGNQTATLQALVTNPNGAEVGVTWSYSPAVGTLSGETAPSNGASSIVYRAPQVVTSQQVVTVTATSKADPSARASRQLTLTPPTATVQISPSSATPQAGQTQRFTASVLGVSQTGVTWSHSPQVGAISVNGNTLDYTAPIPIATTQTVTITATSTFDTAASATARVQLNAPGITVSPATASLTNSQKQQFTATVTNLANSTVTWSIAPQFGTIDQTGMYTAPAAVTGTQRVTVTATSVADSTKSATATVTVTAAISIGAGAPTEVMAGAFQNAFMRNGFGNLTVLPPIGNVRTFGNGGYVQEFTDAENSSLRHGLVTGAASAGGPNIVFQIRAPLQAYYSTVSANTAGYPLADSDVCTAQGVVCAWGIFDRGYALFAFASALPNGAGPNFTVNGTFYTEWTSLGGMNGLGSPVSAQAANVTATIIVPPATTPTTATVQTFDKGAIYSITRGPNTGRIFGVMQPIYDLYQNQSGPLGTLGFPITERFQVSPGVYRQNFEGGALQFQAGSDPSVLLPVVSVALAGAQGGSTVNLNVGQSLTVTATPMTTAGEAPDRPVSWTSTNGRVVSIQATGGTAVITAAGSGAATVQAVSQGVSSARVNFIVTAPCCQIGEGAPSAVQQAFQDALTRNKLSVVSPLPAPVERAGGGYVQMAPSADGRSVYLLALSDRVGAAYVVTGALLVRYQAMGGPAGALGYPTSDAGAGGTQLFANGALGGSPVRLVGGPVLAKWALLNYESGAAGVPLSEASPFTTPGASSGQQQSFSKGVIYAATAGARAGQAFLVAGLILARHTALGGASGDFGMPVSDEFITGAVHQQNFEGGSLTYANGDSAAVEHDAPRAPSVIASPSAVTAGSRARLAVLGFPNNSTLRISVAGSPDFVTAAPNGAYSWEMAISLNARSGSVAIRAVDGRGISAEGALTVKGFADNRIQIAKVQGDNQTGLPGSVLPLALRVALTDSANLPIAGAPMTFVASPGLQLSTPSVATDAAGRAEVTVRLPAAEGVAAITVNAPSIAQIPVTFYVRASANTLPNFPKLAPAGETLLGNGPASIARKGVLLAAVASILRYHQNRGELRTPNGVADPAQLNGFLKQLCSVDSRGVQVCDGYLSAGAAAEQVVNLWRAAEFTGGLDVVAQSPTISSILDVLAQGSPALLSLAISRNGAPAGGNFVVAIGVAGDGAILIYDPNLALGRSTLNDYLRGFTNGGADWKGELRGVVQFAPEVPPATRFLLGAVSQPSELMKVLSLEAQSATGNCGVALELIDSVETTGAPSGGLVSRFRACDGSDSAYQVAVGAAQPYKAFLADLAAAGSTTDLTGSAPVTYKVTRNRVNLVVSPQDISFTADAVVNAATFGPGIAPGGIVSIFGSGLSGARGETNVEVEGLPAPILSASPFQINAVIPAETMPGNRTIQVQSAYGVARQTVNISEFAPAIFLIGNPPVGAVVNQDGTLNSATTPLARGQTLVIYATGLGAVSGRAGLSIVINPVTVLLNGVELPAAFAGLTPGFRGLYQVNVAIPPATPPGLAVSLALKQGEVVGNIVAVAVQ
jgi:uncharacterized protein (TIGR03437 family)